MKLTFKDSPPEKITFFDLFETTGWNKKYQLSSVELLATLEKSWYCVFAYEEEKLLGFGRIICDGIVHALILDLIVHPDFQNIGIGEDILDKLIEKCKQHQIRDIQLFCAKGYSGFYEKRRFKKRTENAPGMEYAP